MKTGLPKAVVYEMRDPDGKVAGVYDADNVWAGWVLAFDRQSHEFRQRYWKREGPTKTALKRMGWRLVPCAHIAEDLRGLHDLPRAFLVKLRKHLNQWNYLRSTADVAVPAKFVRRYAKAKIAKKLYSRKKAAKPTQRWKALVRLGHESFGGHDHSDGEGEIIVTARDAFEAREMVARQARRRWPQYDRRIMSVEAYP